MKDAKKHHTRNLPPITVSVSYPDLVLLDELVQTGKAASISHGMRLAIDIARPTFHALIEEAKKTQEGVKQ